MKTPWMWCQVGDNEAMMSILKIYINQGEWILSSLLNYGNLLHTITNKEVKKRERIFCPTRIFVIGSKLS